MNRRLGLKGRYTVIILGFVVSTAVVLSGMLLANFQQSSHELTLSHEETISRELMAYKQQQGDNLSRQLADNLSNPMYFIDMDTIADLLEVALAHPDVAEILLLDNRGLVVHNGHSDLGVFGTKPALHTAALDAVLTGESLLLSKQDLMLFLKPVKMGEEVIGALSVKLDLANINSDIKQMRVNAADAERSFLQKQLLHSALITALFILIGTLFAVYVARRMNQPIQQLVNFAHQLGQGRFVGSAEVERNDEIGDLARAFNGMATSLRKHNEEAHFLAYHDSLTGLPNRRYFRKILGETIAHAERHQEIFAVLFIDLDDFKWVNDTLGHEAGDEVIQKTADRITGSVRDVDDVTADFALDDGRLMSRVGGDEFVVVLKRLSDPLDASIVAQRILVELKKPLIVQDREIMVGSSIGIATYPDNGRDVEVLLKHADMAMYSVKEAGKNDYRYFSSELDQMAHRKLELVADLQRMIPNQEMELWYQPQYDLATQKVIGAEALLRWRHPEKGFISPAEFIPVAEERDVIHQIGGWVIRQASGQLQTWSQLQKDFCISVNVSAAQLQRETLLDDLGQVLPKLNDCAGQLHLEITETCLLKDENAARQVLEKVSSMGLKIWLDDFGTGYSSLSHLKNYPVGGVKIDRSFVSDVGEFQLGNSIVQAVMAVADMFGLDVVAEGVETEYQKNLLQALGCPLAQGFYLGRPMPADDFDRMLRAQIERKQSANG